MSSTIETPFLDRQGKAYVPAVGPRLKRLLVVVFALVALLGANSVYLTAIRIIGREFQNWFYIWMFLLHVVLGIGLIAPFLIFAFRHLYTAWGRKNRKAVRAGVALLAVSLVLMLTGVVLLRLPGVFEVKHPTTRGLLYALHVLAPLAAIALYVVHRRAGPKVKWKWGYAWGGAVVGFTALMAVVHREDPRQWNLRRSVEGEKYFDPSEARTKTGGFLSAEAMTFDCRRCHEHAFQGWFHSAHHFSSFNNRPYLFSVNETRQVSLKRDGNVKASRWCAGCHDPVPFFTGQFDDPNFDIHNHPTAKAGITCAVCHSITEVTSTIGNASFIIEEPQMYPFANSENPVLRWVHDTLVKASPNLHKNTFLKPFHRKRELGESYDQPRQAEFCSTCHKVSLPFALNHYKEWLRGQNHYDAYLTSGVSGHGARSFYYPDVAKVSCAECHMPLTASADFGARDFDATGELKIHDHLFPAANTGIAFLNQQAALRAGDEVAAKGFAETIRAHQEFLKDQLRIDIFGIKEGGTTEGKLIAPLRPEQLVLEPGREYLVEVVIRTLGVGHLFTQGTADSNEIWVDLHATAGDATIGRSGAIGEKGEVDPWSHFVNLLMLDRHGNRIDRRNPQDIFVPLYNHQIPPGAAQVVHYRLKVPDDAAAPVKLTARLNYRKFDYKYMQYVFNSKDSNPDGLPNPIRELPVTVLAEDTIMLPVAGVEATVTNPPSPIEVAWQRWNDYGIGCLLEQGEGSQRGELRQAEEAFRKVVELGRPDGWVNLARVHLADGTVDAAVKALTQAIDNDFQYPWVVAWLSAQADLQNANLERAVDNLRRVLDTRIDSRRFDFSLDYNIRDQLGQALLERALQERIPARRAERDRWLNESLTEFRRVLETDSENLAAHNNLAVIYQLLGNEQKAAHHRRLHQKYRPDDNARDRAVAEHRRKNPAADHAAQAVVIYDLHREQAPGLAAVSPATPDDGTD